jgi:hypothetical protein
VADVRFSKRGPTPKRQTFRHSFDFLRFVRFDTSAAFLLPNSFRRLLRLHRLRLRRTAAQFSVFIRSAKTATALLFDGYPQTALYASTFPPSAPLRRTATLFGMTEGRLNCRTNAEAPLAVGWSEAAFIHQPL